MPRWRFVLPALVLVAVAVAIVLVVILRSSSPGPTASPGPTVPPPATSAPTPTPAPITAPTATPVPHPRLEGVKIEPEELRFAGGPVEVEATVRAGAGVREVGAVAVDGRGQEVTKGVGKLVGETWRTVIELPPNTHTDGQPLIYRIIVRAVDTSGQVVEREGQVRVLAADLPPPPPF